MEIDLGFTNDGLSFAGTLSLPESPRPAPGALLVSGSGPLDRDGNAKRLPIGVQSQLAAALANAGVASYRFDKRGAGGSEGDFPSTGFWDNVSDARAAFHAMRDHPDIDADRCFVVGHSEGAAIATELAEEAAGVVLLAAPAQAGRAVLEWQGGRVSETLPPLVRGILRLFRIDVTRQQAKQLDRLAASTDDVVRVQLQKVNAKWFREFLVHDPAETLAGLTTPVLAITGMKDIQVDPDDVARIGSLVAGPFEGHTPVDVTHLLRTEAGPASMRTYKAQVKRPIDPEVVRIIVDWLERATA